MIIKFDKFIFEYLNWTKEDRIRQIKIEETSKVYEDDDLLVIIPKTLDSACLYGRGTNWCYVSNYEKELIKNGKLKEDETTFFDYTSTDIFYIFILKKENKKYTLRFETGDFVDESSNEHNFYEFIIKYPKLKKILENNIKFGTYTTYKYPFIHLDYMNSSKNKNNLKDPF